MIRVLFVYLLLINFANSSTLEEYNNFQCSSDSEYAPPINEDSSIGWTASSSTFVYNFPKTKTKEEVIALINQYYPPYYSINPTTKTVQKRFYIGGPTYSSVADNWAWQFQLFSKFSTCKPKPTCDTNYEFNTTSEKCELACDANQTLQLDGTCKNNPPTCTENPNETYDAFYDKCVPDCAPTNDDGIPLGGVFASVRSCYKDKNYYGDSNSSSSYDIFPDGSNPSFVCCYYKTDPDKVTTPVTDPATGEESSSASDGTSRSTAPDGTITETAADGTTTTITTDGTVTITSTNGSTSTTTADGNTITTTSDGFVTETNSDGTTTTTSPFGDSFATLPDGTTVRTSADGTTTVTSIRNLPTGTETTRTTTNPDGTSTTTTTNPDGTETIVLSNGNITHTDRPVTNSDGTVTTTSSTTASNGSVTTSTSTNNQDGTTTTSSTTTTTGGTVTNTVTTTPTEPTPEDPPMFLPDQIGGFHGEMTGSGEANSAIDDLASGENLDENQTKEVDYLKKLTDLVRTEIDSVTVGDVLAIPAGELSVISFTIMGKTFILFDPRTIKDDTWNVLCKAFTWLAVISATILVFTTI